MFFQPLVGHHKAGAVPNQNLQPVSSLGAEDKDRTGERILLQDGLNQRGQTVMATPKINGLGRNQYPHSVRRQDHDERIRERATEAIRLALAHGSSRIVMEPH